MDCKIRINQSYGYFWNGNKAGENFNFYDYKTQEAKNLFVIEGYPECSFKDYIDSNTDGLSVGHSGVVDIQSIFTLCPDLRVLYLECQSIRNADCFKYFEKLEYISCVSKKNANTNFVLPLQLKSFVCVWKDKYQIEVLPGNQLEYINIENGITFNFNKLFKRSFNLIKVELLKCVLNNCLTDIANLRHLNYLSMASCTIVNDSNYTPPNKSLKYLYLSKTKFYGYFISHCYGLEVLILENCNEIESISFINTLLNIRGLWVSGNTKIIDGDLSPIEKLQNLENLFIRDYKHYSHRSKIMWDWSRFSLNKNGRLLDMLEVK